MKESEIQRQILDWLTLENIFAFRLNTSGFVFQKRFIRAHSLGPGAADILAFKHVGGGSFSWFIPIWIECKSAKGRQSAAQKSFQSHIESLGHKYVLARSFDDVRALWLERCSPGGVEK